MGGASQAKKGKVSTEWEDSPSQFEEELALFDEMEMEVESGEGQAGHDVIPVGMYVCGYKNDICCVLSRTFCVYPLCVNLI